MLQLVQYPVNPKVFIVQSILILRALACQGQAQFDLSEFQFSGDQGAKLNGQWEFYWNQLLEPSQFESADNPTYITVPGVWQREGDYSVLGYGTYRCKVKLPKNQQGLALYFPIINCAAKVWINDQLVAESGVVNTDNDSYWPRLMSTIAAIPPQTAEITIAVQVANFTYFNGGISASPQIALAEEIIEQTNRSNGIENFFAGSLIAMFIYQLMLFFLNTKRKPYFWLAMICLGVALRALIVHGGSFLLPNIFPSVHWEIWKKIEFGCVYAFVGLFPAYIYYLFPQNSIKWALRTFAVLAGLLLIPVIFTPHYIYGLLLEFVHLLLLLTFVFVFYTVARAWRSGNKDARVIFFGVAASFPFILTEILQNSEFINLKIQFDYLVEMGLLVFLMFQVYLLARHYARAYRRLEVSNRELERMVSDRTSELATSNSIKDKLLSIVSHDVRSPLNSLQGILNIYNSGALKKDEFDHFAKTLEGDLQNTSMMVDNILLWTRNQMKGIDVKIDEFDLKKLLDNLTHLFKTIAGNKGITICHNLESSLTIKSDQSIFDFVTRNLVANAIKFSKLNTEVCIEVVKQEDQLKINVKDQGVGMDDQTLRDLLYPETVVSNVGTRNEKGTGLGLSLCKEYLEKIGGELIAETREGVGSTFTIILKAGNF